MPSPSTLKNSKNLGRWLSQAKLAINIRNNRGPTPADDMVYQINGGMTSRNINRVPLHPPFRLWDIDLECKLYFHLKRGLWSSSLPPQPKVLCGSWCADSILHLNPVKSLKFLYICCWFSLSNQMFSFFPTLNTFSWILHSMNNQLL